MGSEERKTPAMERTEAEEAAQGSKGKTLIWNFQPTINLYLNHNPADGDGGRGEPKAEDDTEEDRPLPEAALPDSPLQKPDPEMPDSVPSSCTWPREIQVTVKFD